MDFVGTDATFDERGDEIFIMRVKPNNFEILAKVFEHYILNGEVKQLSQHRAMKDLRFLQYFFEYIDTKDTMEEVLLSEDSTFQESAENPRKVGMLFGAIDQEVPNVELVSAILKTGTVSLFCFVCCYHDLKAGLLLYPYHQLWAYWSAILLLTSPSFYP